MKAYDKRSLSQAMLMIKIQEVSAPGCSHCEEARRTLQKEIKSQFPDVEIEFIDMLSDKGQKMVQEYGIMASPGIIINKELFSVGGLNKSKLIEKIISLQH